jgi:hypothetical protein
MKKLISAKEYIILVWEMAGLTYIQKLHLLVAYANFLSQKLELWMFVPCKLVDGVWVVLEYPDLTCKRPESKGNCTCGEESVKDCREWWQEYQEAKDRVLFLGVEYVEAKKEGNYSFLRFTELSPINYPKLWNGLTIEHLIKYNIPLTESAKKQIGS